MSIALLRPVLLAALLAFAPWAQALVFAVNEGVTYRVSNDEIRARYAAIAADLSKILQQPVRVEPVSAYPALRKGLADKAYDLALVHPARHGIRRVRRFATSRSCCGPVAAARSLSRTSPCSCRTRAALRSSTRSSPRCSRRPAGTHDDAGPASDGSPDLRGVRCSG